ncbi:MAG: tetratricopeptide repeat protein, partial [Planctomycetaceae bacterium]
LLRVAVANGLTGRAESTSVTPDEPTQPEETADTRFGAAEDALNAGDFNAAAATYRAVLADSPGDAEARAGLARVDLSRRVSGVEPAAARAAADRDPTDVDAQMHLADLDIVAGRVEGAFDRLVGVVRKAGGDDRERVRNRLVELFEIVGATDPRVTKARASLANALF